MIALSFVSALTVCAQENPKVAPRAIPVNTGPNDVARFLAGFIARAADARSSVAGACRVL